MWQRTFYQRICKHPLPVAAQQQKSVSINHPEKQSLSPLENYYLFWENCSNAVHVIDFQSNANIMQVHSSAIKANPVQLRCLT
jgi:hypothetical protein